MRDEAEAEGFALVMVAGWTMVTCQWLVIRDESCLPLFGGSRHHLTRGAPTSRRDRPGSWSQLRQLLLQLTPQ